MMNIKDNKVKDASNEDGKDIEINLEVDVKKSKRFYSHSSSYDNYVIRC